MVAHVAVGPTWPPQLRVWRRSRSNDNQRGASPAPSETGVRAGEGTEGAQSGFASGSRLCGRAADETCVRGAGTLTLARQVRMLLRFLALEHHAACFEREEVRRSRPVGCVSPPMCKHAVWMFSPGRPVSGPVETPALPRMARLAAADSATPSSLRGDRASSRDGRLGRGGRC